MAHVAPLKKKNKIQNYGQYITTVRGSQVFRRNEQQKKTVRKHHL